MLAPKFFLTVYLPGLLLGLALCQAQGHYEHMRGTVSHYGWIYNALFFNDGYHVEHHERPAEHWTQLRQRRKLRGNASRWPAVLRWLETTNLELMERWVLRSKTLQRFVLKKHERAFRALLPKLPEVRRVGIVGGGLFPRTALILQRLLPLAQLTIIDASAENISVASRFVRSNVQFVHEFYDASNTEDLDLVVIPLAFIGDRATIYQYPTAPAVLVHDWIWSRRGTSAVVSLSLLKRLNLVQR